MLEVYGPHSPKVEMINGYKAARARINAAAIKHCEALIVKADEVQVAVLQVPEPEPLPEPEPVPTPIRYWFHTLPDEGQPPKTKWPPTMEEIQNICARHFGLTRADLTGPVRTRNIVRPRQIAIYLCKQLTTRTTPDIGRRFGGRDHSTILWSIEKVGRLCRSDRSFAHDVAHLEARFS